MASDERPQPNTALAWSPRQSARASDTFELPSSGRVFTIFSRLPLELRSYIWKLAIRPRIIKWVRKDDQNVFTVPMNSFHIFDVCKESRQTAFFIGKYRNISSSSTPLYFSPTIDYLFFDPAWTSLVIGRYHNPPVPPMDPLNAILPDFGDAHNIMIHPHYSTNRKRPTALLERFSSLERVLVAADEKSIGHQSEFMLGAAYDLERYYTHGAKSRIPDLKVPYIAVGCLGWTGAERRKMHHGNNVDRQLVAVFDDSSQMKSHLALLREEEWKFTQEQFYRNRSKPILKLRRRQSIDKLIDPSIPTSPAIPRCEQKPPNLPANPPPYSQQDLTGFTEEH